MQDLSSVLRKTSRMLTHSVRLTCPIYSNADSSVAFNGRFAMTDCIFRHSFQPPEPLVTIVSPAKKDESHDYGSDLTVLKVVEMPGLAHPLSFRILIQHLKRRNENFTFLRVKSRCVLRPALDCDEHFHERPKLKVSPKPHIWKSFETLQMPRVPN